MLGKIGSGTAERDALGKALNEPRIAGLDFLRAVAILLVLISHSGFSMIDGGFGVEMFFVLSGFLITRALLGELQRNGSIRLGEFYRRRAARLLPAFYLYLLMGLAPLILLHREVPWGAVTSSAVYVINYYQAFTGAPSHYLSHCWSLAIEEQFYLLWPLLLIYAVHKRWHLATTLSVMILLVWIYRSVAVTLGASEEYLYRALETRADQLAVGCLLAFAITAAPVREFFVRWSKPVIAALLIGLMLASLTFARGSLALKYEVGYVLEPVLVALIIPLTILAANRGGIGARILNAKPMILIGQISYGMYLYHPYIIHPARHVLELLRMPALIAILGSIVALCVVSWISFYYFESPLRQRWSGRRPHLVPEPVRA